MSHETISQSTDDLINGAAHLGAQGFAEKRDQERHPYKTAITLRLLSPGGQIGQPLQVQGVDISQGGICVESRNMFHPGSVGGMLLVRSDGSQTLVGVRVAHCRYVSGMKHNTGFQFIPVPPQVAMHMS
jgi:hypothetical protein